MQHETNTNGNGAMNGSVLLANRSFDERRRLAEAIQSHYEVCEAPGFEDAVRYIDRPISLVVAEPTATGGLELLQTWKKTQPKTPFFVVADANDGLAAVNAMKLGATECFFRPLNFEQLVTAIRQHHETLAKSNGKEKHETDEEEPLLPNMVGRAEPMQALFRKIARAAAADCPVLIIGETGTGKELVAQSLHEGSRRRNGPFVAANVAAIPETLIESELFGHVKGAFTGADAPRTGLFEQADGGTILLDEIGDLDLANQTKLLRVLESGKFKKVGGNVEQAVNVRVVSATHCDLESLILKNKFREDLFYRLNVFRMDVPPLRRRESDIPLLCRHFLKSFTDSATVTPLRMDDALVEELSRYSWPGNVRQLRNLVERLVAMAETNTLTIDDLAPHRNELKRLCDPPEVHLPTSLTWAEIEKMTILQRLDHFAGSRQKTADSLSISVRTLQRKLKRWNSNDDDSDGEEE